jgi:hypothetical protein
VEDRCVLSLDVGARVEESKSRELSGETFTQMIEVQC